MNARGFLLGIVFLCSIFSVSVHASLLLGDYIGSGTDPYRTDEAIGPVSLYTGWTPTLAAQHLSLSNGASAGTSNESTIDEEPLVCNIDPSIDGSEIIKAKGNTVYVFDSNGQVQKSFPMPSPKNGLTCVDVDNDAFGDVVQVVFETGTPILRVVGYDSGSDSIMTKSENSLSGLGSSPYSDVTCKDADSATSSVCAVTTSTKLLVYLYDTGSTNFGTLLQHTYNVTTTLTSISPQPTLLEVNDAFDTTLFPDEWLVVGALMNETVAYRLDVGSSPAVTFYDYFNFGSHNVYDFKVITNTYKGLVGQDVTLQNDSVIYLTANAGGAEYSFWQLRLSNGMIVRVQQNGTPSWFDEDETDVRFGLFDRDSDGDKDVMFLDFIQAGNVHTAYYTYLSYDSVTQRIGTIGYMNQIQTWTTPGCNNIYSSAIGRTGIPVTHDIDGDGDLEYMQGFATAPGNCNSWSNPVASDNADDSSRISRTVYAPSTVGGTLTASFFSMNTTVASNVLRPSIIFGDTQQDGYFDMLNGHIYYRNSNSVNLNSPPNYDAYEQTPTLNRCVTGDSCVVNNGTTVVYQITVSDVDTASHFYAYDCDDRYGPAPSALAVFSNAVNFTCSYPNFGTFNTTVYVSETATYASFKKIVVTVSDNGQICNYNGVPEPHLGETVTNCAPDFTNAPSPEELELQNNNTLNNEYRQEVLNQSGVNLQNSGSVVIDSDGNIVTSGTLSDFANMTQRLFGYIMAFWVEILVVVVLTGLITLIGGSAMGRRR